MIKRPVFHYNNVAGFENLLQTETQIDIQKTQYIAVGGIYQPKRAIVPDLPIPVLGEDYYDSLNNTQLSLFLNTILSSQLGIHLSYRNLLYKVWHDMIGFANQHLPKPLPPAIELTLVDAIHEASQSEIVALSGIFQKYAAYDDHLDGETFRAYYHELTKRLLISDHSSDYNDFIYQLKRVLKPSPDHPGSANTLTSSFVLEGFSDLFDEYFVHRSSTHLLPDNKLVAFILSDLSSFQVGPQPDMQVGDAAEMPLSKASDFIVQLFHQAFEVAAKESIERIALRQHSINRTQSNNLRLLSRLVSKSAEGNNKHFSYLNSKDHRIKLHLLCALPIRNSFDW